MDNSPIGGFNLRYENNSTSSYLVIIPEKSRKHISYQTQMLLNNRIEGILSFHMNYMEQNWNYYFDITSKCTFASFLSRKRFTRDEFLITLLKVINNIENIRSYLLTDNNILLDSEYIYVEPQSISVFFIYLPFHECKNDYKDFFIDLIVNQIKFENEVSDNYIQKILETVKSDQFSLGALKQLIERLLGENSAVLDELPPEQKHKPVNIPKNSIKSRSEDKAGNVMYEVLLQIAFIVTFICTAGSSFVKMSENPKITLLLLFALFLLADILIIRIINEQKRKKNENSNYNVLKFISGKMRVMQVVSKTVEEVEPVHADSPVIQELPDEQDKQEFYHGETEIIKMDTHTGYSFLKEKEGEDFIEIDKESLLIGRMDNFVDHVINTSAIGKIHAEIMKEGSEYYIMDCNSRNGTFINGSRLLPNTRNRLKNNDEVRFANKEFVFCEAGV